MRKALKVENNVRLVHVQQTTQQKIVSMSAGVAGYLTYEPLDIDFKKSKLVVRARALHHSERQGVHLP